MDDLSTDELAALAAAWERKGGWHNVRVLTPLPRRVRLRLAVCHVINGAGIWLVNHGRIGTAERMWRLCRMWRN